VPPPLLELGMIGNLEAIPGSSVALDGKQKGRDGIA
jgi:hypothetical protein